MNHPAPDTPHGRHPLILSLVGGVLAIVVTLVLLLPTKPKRSRSAPAPAAEEAGGTAAAAGDAEAPQPAGFAARLAEARERILNPAIAPEARYATAQALVDAAPDPEARVEALTLRRSVEAEVARENERRLEETRARAEALLGEGRADEALAAIAAYRPDCDSGGTWARRAGLALDPIASRAGWLSLKREIDACLDREAVEEARARMETVRACRSPEAEAALAAWTLRIEAIRGRAADRATQAARARRFESRRPEAERRVREARDAVALERREEAARDRRLEAALRSATQKTPLRFRAGPDLVLEEVRVAAYAARQLRLAWPDGELVVPVERLPADTLAVLLSQAAAGASAADQLHIGALFLLARQWDRAEGSFRKALQMDPSLASRCPDVNRLRAADRLIRWNDGALATPRILAHYQDAVATELARIDRAVDVPPGDDDPYAMALSLDDELPGLSPALASHYRSVLDLLILRGQDPGLEPFSRAREAAERLARLYPTFAPPSYFLGRLAEEAESRHGAVRWYDETLRRCADFPEALTAQARLRVLSGDWPNARALVERALNLQPDLAPARLIRARLLIQDGRTADALEEAAVARALAPRDASLRRRCRMLANVARGPGWAKEHRHATRHYRFRSDLPVDRIRALGEEMETVYSLYERLAPPPRALADDPVEVLVFNTAEGYLGYVEFIVGDRLENALGIYSPWYGQLMGFEFRDPAKTRAVLLHEACHRYLDRILPFAPIWIQEGMAEYAGGARLEQGQLSETVGIQAGRLQDLRLALRGRWSPVPFPEIMTETQLRFYTVDPEFKYAQAWSMVYYFRHGSAGRWRGTLQLYLNRLAAGDTPQAAFDATFGRQAIGSMEMDWRAFVSRL